MLLVVLALCLGWTRGLAGPGSLDLSFDPGSGANGEIRGIAMQNDGRLIVVGDFTSFAGLSEGRICRLNPDGSVDTGFNSSTGANGSVRSVRVLTNDQIIISGVFQNYNGSARTNLARLNSDGSLDATFNANSTFNVLGWIGMVLTAQKDGRLIIGFNQFSEGYFQMYRLTASGDMDFTFQYSIAPPGGGKATSYDSPIGFFLNDGRLLVGGLALSLYNPIGAPNFVFGQNFAGNLASYTGSTALAQQSDGRLLLTAVPVSYYHIFTHRFKRLNLDGTMDLAFATGTAFNSGVSNLMVMPDGKIISAGAFTNYNGSAISRIARINSDGTIDASFDPGTGPNAPVDATLVSTNGKLVIVGQFTSFNGVARGRIAQLNLDDPAPPAFVAQPSSQTAVVGRSPLLFATVSGVLPLNYQWQLNGTNLQSATDAVLRLSKVRADQAGVYTLEVSNSLGSITSTSASLGLLRAPVTPGAPDPATFTGTGPDGAVRALCRRTNGKLLIAGPFANVDGIPRNRVAQLNPDGSLDAAFDPATGPDFSVNALAVQTDGKVFIGGAFTNVSGSRISYIARLNTNGSLDGTFNQSSLQSFGLPIVVNTLLAQPDGKVIAGGLFRYSSSQTFYSVARFLTNGALDTTFGGVTTISSNYCLALQPDGKIIAGITASSCTVVRFGAPSSSANAGSGVLSALALQSDGKILYGGSLSRPGLGRLFSNFSADSAFNNQILAYPQSGFGIQTLALQSDGRIIIAGGSFYTYDSIRHRGVARLNTDGTLDPNFYLGAGTENTPYALAELPDGSLIAGGDFRTYDGCERASLVRLNGDPPNLTRTDTSAVFSTMIPTDLGKLYTLQYSDDLSATNWTPVINLEGSGSAQVFSDPSPASTHRFYRVRVE